MLTSAQIDQAISTRALVRISDTHGWAPGVTGIAMGFRPNYGTIKIGFVDGNGKYTGEFTVVSYKSVELVEPMIMEEFETVEIDEIKAGDEISFKDLYEQRYIRGTVTEITASRDGYKDPFIPSVRKANGFSTHPEISPGTPVRRYL
jgi:hypothetical protein